MIYCLFVYNQLNNNNYYYSIAKEQSTSISSLRHSVPITNSGFIYLFMYLFAYLLVCLFIDFIYVTIIIIIIFKLSWQ